MGIVVKDGDKVSWRGSWGRDASLDAIITNIELTENEGDKYGDGTFVPSVKWVNGAWEKPFVCTVGDDHWAYSYQIKPKR